MNSIVFKIRGDYARFRKSYTTTSALTYLVMHPIAIRGLIGAILGIDKSQLYEQTKEIEVAIQVLKPIRKDMQSFNLINMKTSDNFFRFPSNVEFLRNVEYRVFIKGESNILNKVKETLISGEYVFTPYLGASEHIAKVIYEGEYEAKLQEMGFYEVNTLVDKDRCKINFDRDMTLYTDNIPVKNNQTREYTEYKKVVFTIDSLIKVETDMCYKVGEYNVIFL